MIRLCILAIFAACLHASSGELDWSVSSYEHNFYDNYDFNDECTTAGTMCKSCKELVQCIEMGNGEFQTIHLQDCDTSKGITCLKKQCTNETNPRCNNQQVPPFVCSNTGVFPDPYDCKKYHMCAQAEDTINGKTILPIDLKCLDNYGYDPVTTYCKVKLDGGYCPENPPIKPCQVAGETGAINKTSIYYICLYDKNVLLPHLYMCPHGKHYDKNKCID